LKIAWRKSSGVYLGLLIGHLLLLLHYLSLGVRIRLAVHINTSLSSQIVRLVLFHHEIVLILHIFLLGPHHLIVIVVMNVSMIHF
jgi:hypothetical protein